MRQPAEVRAVAGILRHRRAAYTLLELMIVLAIITTLAGLSWPALMRPWSRSVSQQAAQQLARELIHARGKAIEQSRVYEMRWEHGGRAFEIRPLDGHWPSQQETLDPLASSGDALEDADPDRRQLQRERSVLSDRQSSSLGREELGESFDERSSTGSLSSGGIAVVESGDHLVADELPFGVHFPGAPVDPMRSLEADEAMSGESQGIGPLSNNDMSAAVEDTAQDADGEPASESESLAPANAKHWSQPIRFYPDGRSVSAKWTLASDDGFEVDVTLRGLTGLASVGRVRTTWTPPTEATTDEAMEADDESLSDPVLDSALAPVGAAP